MKGTQEMKRTYSPGAVDPEFGPARLPAFFHVLFCFVTILALVVPASAQYIYIDTNANGINDSGDVLNAVGPTTLDIWLNTAMNRNGSQVACQQGFLSYEFVLRAIGGTISWGTYSNQTGFPISLGTTSSTTEYYNGFGGSFGPGSGLNKLGSLSVEIASGNPCLVFATSSALSAIYATSFGSCCAGTRGDNTIRLGPDWSDADGTYPCPVSQPGAIAGNVSANCPAIGTGLLGVTVDAFGVGSGDLIGSAVTDPNGNFTITPLPAGNYVATIVTPLGYATTLSEQNITVVGGQTASANFALSCVSVTANPRTIGFWKHQVGVATGGKGTSQVGGTSLCSYLDLIQSHFNTNAINQVVVYQPPASGICADKLAAASTLLNLQGSVAMIARARQQLLALLLNVAAGYISPNQAISVDGATVSQAITYCDNVIDDSGGNYEKAKTIADDINNGIAVPSGMIPSSTLRIAYRTGLNGISFRATSNPDNGEWTFRFALGVQGATSLRVFNLAGQHVATIVQGVVVPGLHTVRWDGRAKGGGRLARGLYLARLSAPEGSETLKLLLMHP